jgi:hypothetical protein
MPYVPPHLRPGYVAPPPPKMPTPPGPGKVRFPTDVNYDAASNVVVPAKVEHAPRSPGAKPTKRAIKITSPIRLNTSPPARPVRKIANLPPKYRAYAVDQLGKKALKEDIAPASMSRRRGSRSRSRLTRRYLHSKKSKARSTRRKTHH